MLCYIEEQSNGTVAKAQLFHRLGFKGVKQEYCLQSCAWATVRSGRSVLWL